MAVFLKYILIRSLLKMLLIDFIHAKTVQFSFFIETANFIFIDFYNSDMYFQIFHLINSFHLKESSESRNPSNPSISSFIFQGKEVVGRAAEVINTYTCRTK